MHDLGRALAQADLRLRPSFLSPIGAPLGERKVDGVLAAQRVTLGLRLVRRQRRRQPSLGLRKPEGAARDRRQREQGDQRRRQGAEQHIYRRLNQGALTSSPFTESGRSQSL
jgi:hypothetical protein